MSGIRCKAVWNKRMNTKEATVLSVYWKIPHDLSTCNIKCEACGALHWHDKSTIDQWENDDIEFSVCCGKGKIMIPLADGSALVFPPMLKKLLMGKSKSKFIM
jgi:hypothetical protein